MRVVALLCVLAIAGCAGTARKEGFAASGPDGFIYSARTNTVMTENDDGTAERIRRDWLADAVKAHEMCGNGYVVDSRRFEPEISGPFGNGGNIVYTGRCL